MEWTEACDRSVHQEDVDEQRHVDNREEEPQADPVEDVTYHRLHHTRHDPADDCKQLQHPLPVGCIHSHINQRHEG